MTNINKPIKITPVVKNYDWGRSDEQSLVFQYSGQNHFKEAKYAELWMGSHPSGPSITETGESLSDIFKNHKQEDITFLFKVLSVNKALSIQIHPNKQQAQELHAKDPKNYTDANDKPELFLTLSPFKALMGFISESQYLSLRQTPPFDILKAQNIKSGLQQIMSLPKETVEKMIKEIESKKFQFKERSTLIEKIYKDFGFDVGLIVSFLLKYEQLPAGKAFYLSAGQPHAYIEGEILQLMKNSDNVVRLGLTPKFKDVETLLKILDYQNRQILPLEKEDNCYKGGLLRLYEITNDSELNLPQRSIGLILQGSFKVNGQSFSKKDIFFVFAGKISIEGSGRVYFATVS